MRASLETQLVALTVVVALGGVGIHALIVSGQSVGEMQSTLARDREAAADTAAHAVADVLYDALGELQTATAGLRAEDLREPVSYRVAARLDPLLASAFSSVRLVADDGVVLFQKPSRPAGVLILPEEEPRLVADAGTLAWIVPLSANQAPPFVFAHVKADLVYQALFAATQGDGGDLALLDDRGSILLSTRDTNAGSEPLQEVLGGDDAEYLTATAGVPELSTLQVVVFESGGTLATLKARLLISTVAVAVIVGGVAVMMGLAMAQAVARPIQHLSSTAVRLRAGEASVRALPSGAREVRRLAEHLNALIDELDTERSRLLSLQKDLELRVESRTRQLSRERKSLEEFAYTVSHDLRAPLRGISLQLEMLSEELDEKGSPRVQNAIAVARDRVASLDQMIVGVLEYSRRGRVPTITKPVPLDPVLKEVVGALQPRAGIHVQWQAKLPTLHGDPVQVRQVFQNLIGNAIRHHDRHVGHILVRATADASYHIVTVEDDGPGVPAEARPTLFRMFGRGNAKSSNTGVGLGLVRRIVESNGGTIRHEEAPGRGSRFIVTWPKASAATASGRSTEKKHVSAGDVSVRPVRPSRVNANDERAVRRRTTSGS